MPTLENAYIEVIKFTDRGGAPATLPDPGEYKVYFNGSQPYIIDSTGTETPIVIGSGGGGSVSDEAYGGTWDGDTTTAPSRNAVYDKIQTISADSSGWFNGTGTWTYSSADSPTFVIATSVDQTSLISVGMKIKLTQTTAKYFIVTAINATTITVYGGTDYTLANAAITSPQFSPHKTPFGFPTSSAKWTVEVTDVSSRVQNTPTATTWYNPGSLSIVVPIGSWKLSYKAQCAPYAAAAGSRSCYLSLSTSSSSESDPDYTMYYDQTISATYIRLNVSHCEKVVTLASKTSYYPIVRTDGAGMANIALNNDVTKMVLRAVCAYL